MIQTRNRLLATLLLISLLTSGSVVARQSQHIMLSDGNELQLDVYGQAGRTRVLWVAPSYGLQPRHRQVAEDLGKRGLEVWQVDLADALFLPRGANTMRSIAPQVVAELIQHLSRDDHRLLVVSSSYGSIPTLRGLQHWQAQRPEQASVLGLVLFSPNLYTRVPPLGEAPEFIPLQTSVPIYVFQAEKNGNRWHFPAQLAHMQQSATVYSEILPGVTSLFYDEDNAEATRNTLQVIAKRIHERMALLARHAYPLSAPEVRLTTGPRPSLDDRLKPYGGSVQALPFSLQDAYGKTYRRDHFKGKVTVVNFWASWCPPCVEEIPSLNRLRELMQGKDFELISINYAESAERIRDFMQKVAVDFPVLIDPEGKVAGQWRVVAFPSTFVIGPDETIRYGVNAAIHWDTPQVVEALDQLLQK